MITETAPATVKLTARKSSTRPGGVAVYLVFRGSDVVGLLEKARSGRRDTHPWKAYLGTGFTIKFLGAFYDAADVATTGPGPVRTGGKAAALDAIAARLG